MFKKYLYEKIFKSYQRKKIFMIGLSHILNMQKNYSKVTSLSEVDYKIFSQNGEDGILNFLISSLNITNPKFLEIGVGDYTECNTRFMFERYSARGTIVDCIDNLEEKVKKNLELWKGDLKIINEKITLKNVHDLIINTKYFSDLDVFSLDIDGIDYWILSALPDNFSKIAVLEYNPIFGNELEVTVPYLDNFNRTDYHYSNLCFGMSLRAAINLMSKKNFYFIGTNLFKNNAFFISNKFDKKSYFENVKVQSIKESVNSNFRESRGLNNILTYLSGKDKIKKILNCEVVNLEKNINKLVKINELVSFTK